MKRYILTQEDVDRLLLMIDRDPLHGLNGGSSVSTVRDKENDEAYKEAHGFFNYQVRVWVDSVTK